MRKKYQKGAEPHAVGTLPFDNSYAGIRRFKPGGYRENVDFRLFDDSELLADLDEGGDGAVELLTVVAG